MARTGRHVALAFLVAMLVTVARSASPVLQGWLVALAMTSGLAAIIAEIELRKRNEPPSDGDR